MNYRRNGEFSLGGTEFKVLVGTFSWRMSQAMRHLEGALGTDFRTEFKFDNHMYRGDN